ncbi:MAG TPA: hypothetical protein VIP09_06555 [Dehalococcoidia bacterium]
MQLKAAPGHYVRRRRSSPRDRRCGQVHAPEIVIGRVAPPGEFAEIGTVTCMLPLTSAATVTVPVAPAEPASPIQT